MSETEPTTLQELKQELQQIATEASRDVWQRRQQADDATYCRWDGQAPDGTKDKNVLGKDPFPFDGASDSRVRMVDTIISRRVRYRMAGARRATRNIVGMESTDGAFAGKMRTLLKWITSRKQGRSFWRELKKVARWMDCDVPAGAVMGIYWEYDTQLERKTLSLEEAVVLRLELLGEIATAEDAQVTGEILTDENRIEDAKGIVAGILPHLKPNQVARVAKELRSTGSATYPNPYARSGLTVTAHRLYEDMFVRSNVRELQEASAIFVREWLKATQLKARELTHGYSKAFITKVLTHEKSSAISEVANMQTAGDYSKTAYVDPDAHKGEFEIWTAYTRAADEDGIPGIYIETFHHEVDESAKERELLDYAHGQYPCVDFWNETITNRLMDSRSTSELGMTDQAALKRQTDTFSDHTSITVLPSVFVPMKDPQKRLVIGPLRQIPRRRREDYEFMQAPAYPQASETEREAIMRRVALYFGLPYEGIDPNEVILQMQELVDDFMDPMAEVFGQMLQLWQQYGSDEELQRIVGGKGVAVPRTREDIQGRFDLDLTFDVRTVDFGFLKELASVLSEMVIPNDTQATIQYDRLVRRLFEMADPNLAEDTLQDVETASQQEVDDEENNFAKIYAGIEPEMKEKGQNWPLRLQVIEGIVKKNPASYAGMQEPSKAILAARMKHLQFMIQQRENAQTGRVGATPALQE